MTERENLEQQIELLEQAHADLEERLLELENSRFFQLLRWPGRLWLDWRGRLGQTLLRSPLHPLYLKLMGAGRDDAYRSWVEVERASMPPASRHAELIAQMRWHPIISVVMPVYQPRPEWLEQAVESLRSQTYPHWELCICDDGSGDAVQWEALEGMAAADSRIRVTRLAKNQGIAAATNRACELAHGDYLAFLDQDDLLASPHCLFYVAETVQESPADLIYSDEDRLGAAGERVEPIFKPAWSPDLLLSCMYMGHLLVVRREVLERVGGLRTGFDGSQDYDLALRVTECGGPVRHIPQVLYHWRRHAHSTASSAGTKSWAWEAGWRALTDAIQRRQCRAEIENSPVRNTFHLRRHLSSQPKASLVICSRQVKLLSRCLRAIERTTAYPDREIVVVQHRTGGRQSLDCVRATGAPDVIVPYWGAFNFAAMNNEGAQHATGDVIVFVNDDVQPLDPRWLELLLAQVERPEVGIAGPLLKYPTGAVQHAGLAIGIMTGVGHIHRDTFGSTYWPWWMLTRNVSAVTGACLAIRKALFTELGGFDPSFPVNYNDADLCLRAREAGFEVIYEPTALLRHAECQTRRPGIRYAERALFNRRWAARMSREDPYYSPNLTACAENAALRADPLDGAKRKWR